MVVGVNGTGKTTTAAKIATSAGATARYVADRATVVYVVGTDGLRETLRIAGLTDDRETGVENINPINKVDEERSRDAVRYYQPAWRDYEAVAGRPCDLRALRDSLEDAVERQLMSDVPYATLLSGGLDSSVVAAAARKFASRRIEDHGHSEAWWPQLHSFAIGLEGSPDLQAAATAAASSTSPW